MILDELIKRLETNVSPDVYVLIPPTDMDEELSYEISDVMVGTLIKYKSGWEFKEEVEEILKAETFGDEDEFNREMAKVIKQGVLKGTFIILMPFM